MSQNTGEAKYPIATGQALLDDIPYARTLGVRMVEDADGPLFQLPFGQDNIGNPILPALHGGAIGGFMEITAIGQLIAELDRDCALPKPIGISVDYLRRGKPEDVWARATIARMGARVANVRVVAWQSDPDKPVATFHGHFLLAKDRGCKRE